MLDVAGNKIAERVYDVGATVRRSLTRTYNSLGELTSAVDGLNQTVFSANYSDSYDDDGNLVHSADGRGVQQQRGYDALNRLVQTIQDYDGTAPATGDTATAVNYDALDRLTGVTDPSGLVTSYTYDGLSNATGQASPDTGTTAGNVLTSTDANGITATNSYDALDRLVGTTYPDSTQDVAYHHDESDTVRNGSTSFSKMRRICDSVLWRPSLRTSRRCLTQALNTALNVYASARHAACRCCRRNTWGCVPLASKARASWRRRRASRRPTSG